MEINNGDDFVKMLEANNSFLEFEYNGNSYKLDIHAIIQLQAITKLNNENLFSFVIKLMKPLEWKKASLAEMPFYYNGNDGIEQVGKSSVSGIPRYNWNPKISQDDVDMPVPNLPKYTIGPKLGLGILSVLNLS